MPDGWLWLPALHAQRATHCLSLLEEPLFRLSRYRLLIFDENAHWTGAFVLGGATSAGMVQMPSSSARICPSILSMTKREKGPR
jgi:hypothetical protein